MKRIKAFKIVKRQRVVVNLPVECVGQTSPVLGSKVRWPKEYCNSQYKVNSKRTIFLWILNEWQFGINTGVDINTHSRWISKKWNIPYTQQAQKHLRNNYNIRWTDYHYIISNICHPANLSGIIMITHQIWIKKCGSGVGFVNFTHNSAN